MLEGVSNEDISEALAELVECFGVREDIPPDDLIRFLLKRKTAECIQGIAVAFGLPVHIIVSYVPKDFRPGNNDGFRTSALSRTDASGRGREGIVAQVSIPESLPMFGSSSLQGYPIRVRVSENCEAYPETFVAIMAHELSHVLLESFRHPRKDSELHADLIPILLGFRGIVRTGRKTARSSTTGEKTITHTTTYGYLTDSQFEFACNHVGVIVERHRRNKLRLLKEIELVLDKVAFAGKDLALFREYFSYLDSHLPKKMNKAHAERMVELHSEDHAIQWEHQIAAVRARLEQIQTFVRNMDQFTKASLDNLTKYEKLLKQAKNKSEAVAASTRSGLRLVGSCVGFTYRIRAMLNRWAWVREDEHTTLRELRSQIRKK